VVSVLCYVFLSGASLKSLGGQVEYHTNGSRVGKCLEKMFHSSKQWRSAVYI
jgi:hypothetical protein